MLGGAIWIQVNVDLKSSSKKPNQSYDSGKKVGLAAIAHFIPLDNSILQMSKSDTDNSGEHFQYMSC